jgi:hypothetical protein
LEGLEEGDTVDALLKGRLEDVRNTLQDILESHGGGGTERVDPERGTSERYGLASTRE